MSEVTAPTRLSKAAKEFNISVGTIVEFLKKKGMEVEYNPNAKITAEQYALLVKEFQSEKTAKEQSRQLGLEHTRRETVSIEDRVKTVEEPEPEQEVVVIKDLKTTLRRETEVKPTEPVVTKPTPKPEPKPETPKAETPVPEIEKPVVIETDVKKEEAKEPVEESIEKEKPQEKEIPKVGQSELKILGKIDIDTVSGKSAKKKDKSEPTPTSPVEDKLPQPDAELQIETEKEIPVIETTETEKAVEIQQEEIAEQPEEIISDTIPAEEKESDDNFIKTQYVKLTGPVIMGKMDLPVAKPVEKKPVASSKEDLSSKKKKRKRIKPATTVSNEIEKTKDASEKKHQGPSKHREKGRKEAPKPVLSDEEIQKQIKETLARLSTPSKSKASKYRRAKREAISQHMQEELEKAEQEKSILRVTEFVTANEFASLMNVPVTSVIQTCMNLGIFVSINQRLDAETIAIVAEEFGFKVEFVTAEVQEVLPQYEDNPADHVERAPIVTVMGHVDHGKTSLLDFIRNSNVIAGEAGGITQHIGAYEVKLENGKKITFLDTPGHEAFTAMRARGAKITDVAVIVIAADDSVMPQTIEAINHAQAAGVPIVFAINKIDKPNADPERIKQQLANMNLLVEDWGGKIQSQEISAKKGVNMDLLLEKILLEAEILELKANPKRPAEGTIIESSLDKGRGYVAKILVQNGTLRVGDIVLAGTTFGRVKAMYNERNQIVKEAGPSSAVLMLGLNGAPQAGDSFLVMLDERDAKNIAFKRQQLQREQGIRAQKHITLDEIGRRIAIGDFKELNLIVKGDVDGSVEALADSLIKLGNQQVQVNVIHKSVGQVTESDVLLASASNAIIVGFQVRPSLAARKLAEQEQIDIRLYSIIYTAIEEIKSAIEGMLAPEIQEKITGNAEIREVFKISKVGSVAGCFVLDGKFTRNTKVRVIRDGIVIYTGNLSSLKRFKDDVKEVSKGMECGMSVERFNDIKVGDIIEGYEEIEIKRTL